MKRLLALLLVLGLAACSSSEEETTPTPQASSETTTSAQPPAEPVEVDGKTFLLIGVDARNPDEASRADVMMVAHIDERVTVMNLPRDSWVTIPEHGEAKLNAAYAYGEEELLQTTVEGLIGAEIDTTITVDFESFTAITEHLGQITVDTDEGPVTLTSENALSWVRERYSLPRGDFDRVRRQQAFLSAVADQVASMSTGQRLDLLAAVSPYVLIDGEPTDEVNLGLIAFDVLGASEEPILGTAPYSGTGYRGDQSVVELDLDELARFSDVIETDSFETWARDVGEPIT